LIKFSSACDQGMKIYLIILSLVFLTSSIAGQEGNSYLSNLYTSLADAKSDTARMSVSRSLGFYYLPEDRDSANYYFEKALAIAVRLNLKYDQVSILAGMGIVLMQQEKFSKSLELYLKALSIAKDPVIEKTIRKLPPGKNAEHERMKVIALTYDLIGLLNAYTGNWEDNTNNQLKNYREAEKYAKLAGDEGIIATLNFHMGIAYMNAGRFDSALLLIAKAQSVFTASKDPQLGRSMLFQGDIYKRMGDPHRAARTILEGMALLNVTNDLVHRGQGSLLLSNVYADLGKTDSALYYAKEGLKIYERRKDPAGKRDAYDLLSSYFDKMGSIDSATIYLKLAKSLSDSLNDEERKNLLAFQDIVVDEQVKLEKLEKEKIEAREKLRIYLLMSGILVFMVIVFLLSRNNRNRKKTNEILRQRNEEIENTLHQLRSTQTQLIQSEKMASLGQLTAGIAHEIQNPLNFVNNFSEVNKELANELEQEIDKGNYTEAKAIAKDIRVNEDKINHHGKRADAIVKGMLQHSRASSGIKEPTDINVLTDEYLRLAYHGLRAKDKSFNATMKTDFDQGIGKINIVPQDIGRVILNLITNAYYAVAEKKKKVAEGFEPTVAVATKRLNGKVMISVRDNGNGIPPKTLDKIFQPFFTTKPTGEGTGLGLSLSYDIVKAHGGEIRVESRENGFTEFVVILPAD
jgi:two-component system NtrC family sensor kinase